MPVAILDPIALHAHGTLIEGSIFDDRASESHSFRCCHCGRIVFVPPTRGSGLGQRPIHTCRKCGPRAWTCDSPGCLIDCNPIVRDFERAVQGQDDQPWLLRHHGEPIDRIYAEDGTELLVLRRDHNMTLREREKGRAVAMTRAAAPVLDFLKRGLRLAPEEEPHASLP